MEVFARKYLPHEKLLVDYYNKNKFYVKESMGVLKRYMKENGIEIEGNALLIGWGYSKPLNAQADFSKLEPIFLDEEARRRNVLGFGTIGTGKTYLAMAILHYDILSGKPVVFVDPKPSLETLNVAVYAALEAERTYDFRFMSMFYPEISYRINPLSRYFLPDEIVSHLTSGIFVQDPFFIDVSVELTTMIVLMLYFKSLTQDSSFTMRFGDIIRYMRKEDFKQLYEEFRKLQNEIASNRPELLGYVQSIESLGDLIASSPQEYFSKVTTTLRVHLAQLSVGVAGKLLSGSEDENFVSDIEAGDTPIVFVQLSGLIDPRITRKISRVLSSMIRTLAGRLLISQNRLKRPVSFIVDELSNAVHIGFEEGVNKAREAGVQYTAFTQTISDLYKEVGRDYAGVILGNFNTLIAMSSPDIETANYIATRFGTQQTHELLIRNLEEPTYRSVEKPVIDAGMVMDMPPRHFYYKDYRKIYYGKTADYYVPSVKVEFDVPVGMT